MATWGYASAFGAPAMLFAVSAVGYYWGTLSLRAWHVPVLTVCVFVLSAGGNAAMVAFRALSTELFPTRLRGTLGGFMAVGAALGWLLAMGTTSALAAPLGGIGPSVALIVVLALPTAALLCVRLPETAGLTLETAALEA